MYQTHCHVLVCEEEWEAINIKHRVLMPASNMSCIIFVYLFSLYSMVYSTGKFFKYHISLLNSCIFSFHCETGKI